MSEGGGWSVDVSGRRIRVRGLVQGVGYRPTVWRLAKEEDLAGHVLNDGEGVLVEAWGPPTALERLTRRLRDDAPPLARVDEVTWEPLEAVARPASFDIVGSAEGDVATGVVPDAAACHSCLQDIRDTANRRFRYPFTNCTHCGPRLSIMRSIPYDRARTSMAEFEMCADCRAEYGDPADRRFHAQPNACPVCGPRLWLEGADGVLADDDAVVAAAELLLQGSIVAIKGLGGFHLACDATDNDAVLRLRQRKRRYAKPFAVMGRDLDQIGRYCEPRPQEADLLRASSAPIVLLQDKGSSLAAAIAPGHDRLGFMLPYTPLHHLLLEAVGRPLVMTSGNRSDEPQVIDNDEAHERLADIADYWLMHDRDIVNRLDDSVMRVDSTGAQILRRARGIAPAPVRLPPGFGDTCAVLAMGGELKSTFCLSRNGAAIVSQHLGDLQDAATYADYRRALGLYRDMFQFVPERIAVDRHPGYLSTRLGETLARDLGAELIEVQHHHAHLASCLADNGVEPGADLSVGIVLDGLGLGTDGTIWGGEILVGTYGGFERAACFQPVALPGGDQAMREPWRNLAAHLRTAFGADWIGTAGRHPELVALGDKPLALIDQIIAKGVNAPLSSSAGRLFDAVAAALGICADRQHYEGQAAMELEALARPFMRMAAGYTADIEQREGIAFIVWRQMWAELLNDIAKGAERGLIAARFHMTLIDVLVRTAADIGARAGTGRVALSGGALQNQILAEALHAGLTGAGMDVLVHRHVPANDGGLCLGQAAIAAVMSA